jgi:hypothetical protein
MGGEQAVDIAATSTEYVRISASSRLSGSLINVAVAPKFAFMATSGNPGVSDWFNGEWATSWARILVGPAGGTTALAAGEYSVWITWAAGTETPVYRAGALTVY